MLECQDLYLGYDCSVAGPVNLTIAENQWIGIIGANGSGKSTFLKTMLGNLLPKSGMMGVMKSRPSELNHLISYIPQEREINLGEQMSARSLINSCLNGWRYGLFGISRNDQQRIEQLIELVGATEYIDRPFNCLSGGQKKRVYLAQALVNQPALLLLDEPLADLDPHAKQHFIQALQRIRQQQQLGLFIVSHDMHEIASHLDGFIHFGRDKVHYCETLDCIKEDVYVGV